MMNSVGARKGISVREAIVPCDGTQYPTARNPALNSIPAQPEQAPKHRASHVIGRIILYLGAILS